MGIRKIREAGPERYKAALNVLEIDTLKKLEVKLTGISNSTPYRTIKSADIETVKIGCSITSLKRLLNGART